MLNWYFLLINYRKPTFKKYVTNVIKQHYTLFQFKLQLFSKTVRS